MNDGVMHPGQAVWLRLASPLQKVVAEWRESLTEAEYESVERWMEDDPQAGMKCSEMTWGKYAN